MIIYIFISIKLLKMSFYINWIIGVKSTDSNSFFQIRYVFY